MVAAGGPGEVGERAPPAESAPDDRSSPRETGVDWLDRLRSVGAVRAVVAIAAVAVLARLVVLGARSAHWDEARVAYWILHTIETGDFAYRRIIHGPVVQHVNHVLVALLGATDTVIRLPVALVGGLLPLSALLFREHLEDDEVVVLALFLAFNAVLVYYARFMRSDVLVAAFMFAALGTLVRFYDTRRPRYLYAAAALIALGVGSKENAVVYVLTWVGAAALLADQALYRPRGYESGLALLRDRWRRLRSWRPAGTTRARVLGRWSGHLLGALVVFLGLTVFIYGPRGGGLAALHYPPPAAADAGLGFWGALAQPTAFPGYAVDTLAYTGEQFMEWFAQSSEPGCNEENVIDGWLCFLEQYVGVMIDHALLLSVFAIGGFVYERYVRPVSRNLVLFAAYGGFVSILGYPLGTDVFGAWIVVHALVPLAVPAAVGVARIYRWGVAAVDDRDGVGATVAAVILLLLAVQVGAANVSAVYTNHSAADNSLVQYAQPAADLDPVVEALEAAADEGGDGPDVLLYYGATGDARSDHVAIVKRPEDWERGNNTLLTEPACAEWFNSLPVPWYYAAADADVACAADLTTLARASGDDGAPVVVAMHQDRSVPVEDLEAAGYDHETYRLRTTDKDAYVFVHERLGLDWGEG